MSSTEFIDITIDKSHIITIGERLYTESIGFVRGLEGVKGTVLFIAFLPFLIKSILTEDILTHFKPETCLQITI